MSFFLSSYHSIFCLLKLLLTVAVAVADSFSRERCCPKFDVLPFQLDLKPSLLLSDRLILRSILRITVHNRCRIFHGVAFPWFSMSFHIHPFGFNFLRESMTSAFDLAVPSFVTIIFLIHSSSANYADSSEELDVEATKNAYISSFVISLLSICHVFDSMLDLKYQSVNVSLAGMLGRNYDLLTDKSYYPILQESFTSCQKTPDSRFYIPNNYRVMFLMQRYIAMTAQLSTTFSEATESTTAGGTVSGGGTGKKFAGSGTGSANYQHTKKTMEQEGKAMYHMSVINKMYRLTGDMSAPFTNAFESRLKAVIDALEKDSPLKARYLVERIISDFGTHVTMEALVETHMEYRAYVKKSAVSVDESTKTLVSGQATVELQNAKGGGVGTFNKVENDRSSEESFSMNVEAFVVGGVELKKLNNPTEAFDDTYPVAISRNVYPIYMMMDSGILEHLINNTIDMDIEAELRRHFEDATHEYFERNRINGCKNKDKINYDFQANVDDGTCSDFDYCRLIPVMASNIINETSGCKYLNVPYKDSDAFRRYRRMLIFYCAKRYNLVYKDSHEDKPSLAPIGGIIQKCEPYPESNIYNSQWPLLKKHWNIKENRSDPCERLRIGYPGDISECPSDLNPTEIISFDYVLPDVHIANITEHCFNDTSNNKTKCVDVHTDVVFRDRVHVKSYWCGPKNKDEYVSIGFGGYFDHNQVNNFIGERDCPSDTPKVTLFHGTTFCLTDTIFDNTSELTLLYSNRDRTINCPHGHSKQLITVINFEKIYACILKRHTYYHLDTPAILKGPYLDKRYAMDLYDQGFFTIRHSGKLVEKKLLAENGHKIYGYHQRFLEVLKNESIEIKHGEVSGFVFKNYISIIIATILFIACLVAVAFCCCK